MLYSILSVLVFCGVYGYVSHLVIPQEAWFWTFTVSLFLGGLLAVSRNGRIFSLLRRVSKWEVALIGILSAIILLPFSDSLDKNLVRWLGSVIFFVSFGEICKRVAHFLKERKKHN